MIRVALLANYVADRQPSMLRFARMLHDELAARGVEVEMWHPPSLVRGRSPAGGAVHKWLGYVDKYLLYPPRLSRAAARDAARSTVIHICDHSNAIYVRWLHEQPHVVTCHDLIAVRSALGEFPSVSTRWSGRQLQNMILNGLRQASHIVCDSRATRDDVQRLVRTSAGHAVVHPGVAPAFRPVAHAAAAPRIARLGLPPRFLLHVGGSQWYKNRTGLLELYAALVARIPAVPPLVLVGKPLTPAEIPMLAARALHDRIVIAPSVDDEDLAALYSAAELLVFPSHVEGFGWPVLEAMACGCRVVASDRPSLTEIGSDAVTYLDPDNGAAATATLEAVLTESAAERNARTTAGLTRAASFSSGGMADAYLSIYHETLARRSDAA